jgi:pSer/pThr/pTyr-binding forkhead associated (FHA) protein
MAVPPGWRLTVATLEIYDEFGRIGRTVNLRGEKFSIGRLDDNDLVLDDETVSKHHAVLECFQHRWMVRDLKSRNGIDIDGVRVLEEAMLQHKAELVLGKTRLVYLNPAEKRGKTTEPIKAKPALTPRQQQVLEELCRPLMKGGRFIAPASDAEIADRLYVGQPNIRNFLGELYRKFDIDEGRGRRNRLAEEAIDRGSVRLQDLRDDPEDDQPVG